MKTPMIPRPTVVSLFVDRPPEEVYADLVDLLFASLLPALIMGSIAGGVGALLTQQTGDRVLGGLTVAVALGAVLRAVIILAYRRTMKGAVPSPAEARRWERRYAGANLLFAILLGGLDARALLIGDVLAHMLVTGVLFGYCSGLVARMHVRPWICVSCLMIAAVPTAAAMALHSLGGLEQGLAYGAQATLIAAFAIGSLESVNHGYRTTLRQLITQRSLASLARHDDLTGLPNRLSLRERFDEAAAASRRDGGLIALHYLDLDRFKRVNDRFGHPVGDALLCAVAERMKGLLRAGDLVSRLGGDEFVVLQSRLQRADEARMLAHRIVRILSAPYEIDGQTLDIGASVGIALSPRDGLDFDTLSSCADAALYRVKDSGRGAVAFWHDPGRARLTAVA